VVVVPGDLDLRLNPGGEATVPVTVGNPGGGLLNHIAEIDPGEREPLDQVLANLTAAEASVTALIPDLYPFTEGATGIAIEDGGEDMFDVGNILNTSLGEAIPYSDGVLATSPAAGGGAYFTRKFRGLFVFAADLAGVDSFGVEGNLGADGVGSVDGVVLETTRGSRRFRAFAKRVYDGFDPFSGETDPSVNHLVVVEDAPGATQSFGPDSDDGGHSVDGLAGVPRLYFLLFASRGGRFVSDTELRAVFEAFLDAAGVAPGWLALEGGPPPLLGGGQEAHWQLQVRAEGLQRGEYGAVFRVLSNAPGSPTLDVPVRLTVNGPPEVVALPGPFGVAEDAGPLEVDLFSVFGDAEDPDETLAFEAEFAGDPGPVAALEVAPTGGLLRVVLHPDAHGVALVAVTARDPGGLSATTQIEVIVRPINDPPHGVAPAPSIRTDEDVTPGLLDLRAVASDVDDPFEALRFSVVGATPASLVASAEFVADSGHLAVALVPDASGGGEVVLAVTDPAGLRVELALPVVVAPVNDPPFARSPSVEIQFAEDSAGATLALGEVFGDVDDPAGDLAFEVGTVAPGGLFATAATAGGNLSLVPAPDANGEGLVTVRARDRAGASVEVAVRVPVFPVNDPPSARQIPAAVADAAASDISLALAGYFEEVDSGDMLVYTLEGNSDPSLFRELWVDPRSGVFAGSFERARAGSATLTVRATDSGGAWAEAVFEVGLPEIAPPQVSVDGPPVLNRQTGLFDLWVTVTNASARPVDGFDLLVSGLVGGARLWSPDHTLDEGGVLRVRVVKPLAPGASERVLLQFYDRGRVAPSPSLVAAVYYPAVPLQLVAPPTPVGDGVVGGLTLGRLADGAVLLELPSRLGARFQVEFTGSGLGRWAAASGAATAHGTRAAWVDRGDRPDGRPHPRDARQRCYRVVWLPQ
jgi:hypothetical protein